MKTLNEKPYKRFMVFGHTHWEASGGMCDCHDSFDTLEEAVKYYKESISESYDVEVLDRIEGNWLDVEEIIKN